MHVHGRQSCIGGHVGAATVNLEKGQMGTDATSTIYAAEKQGINVALIMAKAEVDADARQRQLGIFADNQAAIRSLARPEGKSGA